MCDSRSRKSELFVAQMWATCGLYLDISEHGPNGLKEAPIKGLPKVKHSNEQHRNCVGQLLTKKTIVNKQPPTLRQGTKLSLSSRKLTIWEMQKQNR